jgi:N-acetylmuramoyl-L-alanine amidase
MWRRSHASALAVVTALLVVTALGSWVASTRSPCSDGPAVVVLDPGHGGVDPGAINEAVGLVERDLTLVIAQGAATVLRAHGYQVALTRSDNATALGNSERGLLANAYSGSVYVSIHLNSFTQPEPNYVTTFWGIAAKDAAFAEVMQAALGDELRPGTNLGDSGVAQLENGGLLQARMPAVLVETAFLSNPEEAARLATGERLDQIARAIAHGVMDWLGPPCHAPREGSVGGVLPL